VSSIEEKHGRGRALGFIADVTEAEQVEQMVSETVTKLGSLHIMVANAGIAHVAHALELTPIDINRIFSVNFLGVFNCYSAAARQMIKQGPLQEQKDTKSCRSSRYKILGASSIAAFKPFPTLAHYCATKAAVRAYTQTFAIEMAPYGINVNCYAPGIVGTAMWDLVDEKLGEIEGRVKGESLRKYSTELTAMKRISVPEDVSRVVGGFLCSRDSDFVTGQTIIVDGGIVFS